MSIRYRLALVLAAVALLFLHECVRLGRHIGGAYYEWRETVTR